MMFDPPDFPYKDLNETMKEHYGTEDLIFSNNESNLFNERTDKNTSSSSGTQNLQNPELYIVQTENLFNYEPVLLDDNTVNEFLLPLQVTSDSSKETTTGPDLLALHSCSICHEIFINENDLLDHSISMHTIGTTVIEDATENVVYDDLSDENNATNTENRLQLDTEWLVCGVCERVLSTALEVEPVEQLCCKDETGKTKLCSRTLMTMYVCEYCSSLFADGDALDRHRLVCNADNKENYTMDQNVVNFDNQMSKSINLCFSCDVCGTQNNTVEELKAHSIQCRPAVKERRHKISGTTTKMWNCGSCNQLFATARDLYRHKRGEDRPEGSPITAFVCEHCDKVLGSMCALHTHKKMHKVTKPGYPCRVCGRRFNQSGHLAIHMRMHTGERPYPCDLCPKAFKVKVERDDHRRTHTGERPFACNACPKTFTAAARLREHARIHTDQRPYRCDICGAAFRRPYARTVHTLIHTGAKPHECDVCGTAFRFRGWFSGAENQGSFVCIRSGDMWKHKRTIHGSTAGFSGD